MVQTKILFGVSILLIAVTFALLVKHLVGPLASDPMVARSRLCTCYYDYTDVSGNRIPALEQMCWRSADSGADKAHY